ncbi:MAG: DUF4382 domain-containing protein, partial [Candidatus Marinimicrobia bacterium]|nr:DUF4382 domain-containing protein [Candidatus Neomarinimicrobiota bacterium]
IKLEARNPDTTLSNAFITLSEDSATFNLLDLRNGITTSLAELEVPAGSYGLVRIYVTGGSVVMKDSTVYDLKVPSGEQTGIALHINPALEVVSGITSDLLLDFDVEKSFVAKGGKNNINGFNFKPVIRAANVSTVGNVSGTVSDTAAVALENATVWVTQDTVISTTYSGDDGGYAILGLPAGDYTASATLAGYDTVSVDVTVVAASQSPADFELQAQ